APAVEPAMKPQQPITNKRMTVAKDPMPMPRGCHFTEESSRTRVSGRGLRRPFLARRGRLLWQGRLWCAASVGPLLDLIGLARRRRWRLRSPRCHEQSSKQQHHGNSTDESTERKGRAFKAKPAAPAAILEDEHGFRICLNEVTGRGG